MTRPRRETRMTELGLEVRCACCGEFWPADPEFFYFTAGRPHSWCKACYLASDCFQAKQARWLAKQHADVLARRGITQIELTVAPAQRAAPIAVLDLPREPWPRLVAQLRTAQGAAA